MSTFTIWGLATQLGLRSMPTTTQTTLHAQHAVHQHTALSAALQPSWTHATQSFSKVRSTPSAPSSPEAYPEPALRPGVGLQHPGGCARVLHWPGPLCGLHVISLSTAAATTTTPERRMASCRARTGSIRAAACTSASQACSSKERNALPSVQGSCTGTPGHGRVVSVHCVLAIHRGQRGTPDAGARPGGAACAAP